MPALTPLVHFTDNQREARRGKEIAQDPQLFGDDPELSRPDVLS